MKKIFFKLFLCLIPFFASAQSNRQTINFNSNWQFINQENITTNKSLPTIHDYNFEEWENVNLPHTAKVEPLVVLSPWIGISWYKKDFAANKDWQSKKVTIEFEAIMQKAEVWLNGKLLKTHTGGYLPFLIDISKELSYEKMNRLVVKTNNADDAEVPPGKPIKELDFCYFSGIYRNVSIIISNPLHITNASQENLVASGGIRVWFPEVSTETATVAVSTHLKNEQYNTTNCVLNYKLVDKTGKIVASAISDKLVINANADLSISQKLIVKNPALWHPSNPQLYTLKIEVHENNKLVDEESTKIGIRKFELVNNKLQINGKPFLLRGTNRHQEYPYIGNALSDNAQYRDAFKIKEAGFNIVRLSHYPQSVSFMNACDELGILTIAAIPGWQFIGNDAFMQHSYQDARELIRRDRNHASVVFWELSLNETPMSDKFMQQMTAIAEEESPESKLITCGWINKFYDVYIPARQHAKHPDYWKKYNGKTPLFTGEYGDWEYFAQDAGLNQAGYAGLKSDERTSRQLRSDGEKRLLQQAYNYQESHNDNLNNPHLGDANWLIFDYNRGYSPDIESSGIMDIYRLPKFSYYFYNSQSDKPMIKIATYWNETSDYKAIKVYSNCEEVALFLNEKLIERKKADRSPISNNLSYPPFIFNLKKYEKGTLKAIAYNKNKSVCTDKVSTCGKPEYIKLTYDKSGKSLKSDGADVVFVYATICDSKGNTVVDSDLSINFKVKGSGKLIGQNPVNAEAGIATILLQAGLSTKKITIEANSIKLKKGTLIINPIK